MNKLKPIIKWAGGKEKELPYIVENLPKKVKRYIEPFVGGGSVYFNIGIEDSFINDKSTELIELYRCIQRKDREFFERLDQIYRGWKQLEKFVINNKNELFNIYSAYCNENGNNQDNEKIKNEKDLLKKDINSFINKHKRVLDNILPKEFIFDTDNFNKEINKNLISKMSRMHKIELEKGKLSIQDTIDNLECAFKSAYYMHLRFIYNYSDIFKIKGSFYEAIFYFIREYCYASMFRYNAQGKFNVPYGGISYNRKEFSKKIEYLKSNQIYEYMQNTKIFEEDFESFLKMVKPKKDDFIFIDPPYDTEFSTYANNEFDKNDQIRLANCLSKTKANIMIIIKNTDFIYNLYKEKGFKIKSFDKKYLVSFQNRNDKNVKHLLITNY